MPPILECVPRILHPAWKWSKHLTYRHHGEDGVDHTCADSSIDRLLDTRIFEDSCRVVEHLTGNKRCHCEIQLCVAVALNPQKINSEVSEVQEYLPAIFVVVVQSQYLFCKQMIFCNLFSLFSLWTMLFLTAPFSLFLKSAFSNLDRTA